MDTTKYLVLIKNEDKTKDIEQCYVTNEEWIVQYKKNPKTYKYSNSNIEFFENPKELNISCNTFIHKNLILYKIDKFLEFNKYYKIIFENGYERIYNKEEILIASEHLLYLKELSSKINIAVDDDIGFLGKQYKSLKTIDKDSVLLKYIKCKELIIYNDNDIQPIFPFGLNLSQKEATKNVFKSSLSIIEGPPGTGKTQTILNIIANIILKNKTVAIASNNNSATKNVIEKLNKYGISFICAYLGNKENKSKFFEESQPIYPDMKEWKLDKESIEILKEKLFELSKHIDIMLEKQNHLAKLIQTIKDLKINKEYFDTFYKENNMPIEPYKSLYKIDSNKTLEILISYEKLSEDDKITMMYKLKSLILYGIFSFKFYKNSPNKIVAFFQKQFYDLREKELEEEISKLTKELKDFNLENSIKEYTESSKKLLLAVLATYYGSQTNRKRFDANILSENISEFLKEYPIVLSTTHSLRSCVRDNYIFDYLIIDESSQVDIISGALALSCAKNAVIVGDMKQLPNIVTSNEINIAQEIFNNYNISEYYNYVNNSLLSSVIGLFPNAPRVLLREHYRCHPKIIGFCNQKFYNNELIIMTKDNEAKDTLSVYKTPPGNHARGNYNQRQIDIIFNEIILKQNIDEEQQSIGIISPYRKQVIALKNFIGRRNIEADTVHKFQGREKDIIILSTVDNTIKKFTDNPNLVNVAVSRAVQKLIVVVSDNADRDETNIADLIKYIKYNNFEVINSNVNSIFDYLYNNINKKRKELSQIKKWEFDSPAEEAMYNLIEKILDIDKFSDLGLGLHIPLSHLTQKLDFSKLDEEELDFCTNCFSHVDFVIYHGMDRIPTLAIEVDGYKYHVNNEKQSKRDKIKDGILNKCHIPLIRFRTNESMEEKRLIEKLENILYYSK